VPTLEVVEVENKKLEVAAVEADQEVQKIPTTENTSETTD
jgi:hypothetical protein